jgi:ornithine cyclodeaminase/alanine dehydrogenase-like protein (mu-crystallin family)
MRLLRRPEVERALPLADCIEAVAEAMMATSAGLADLPLRMHLPVRDTPGKLVVMPGVLAPQRVFGLKIVSKFPRPAGDRHGSHVGMVVIFDADNGLPLALLEGGVLTEIRTAAASALATRTLSRPQSRVLAILGTGAQAKWHARAIPVVRPIDELRIWGRSAPHAAALAAQLRAETQLNVVVAPTARAAVQGADIVCTTTSSATPILAGDWLAPGMHLNLVGSAIPTTAEVDVECVRRARYFVDSRSSAAAEAGELRAATQAGVVGSDHIVAEIGDVVAGRAAGRASDTEITLYKSLGVASQDLAAGLRAYQNAASLELGSDLHLMESE